MLQQTDIIYHYLIIDHWIRSIVGLRPGLSLSPSRLKAFLHNCVFCSCWSSPPFSQSYTLHTLFFPPSLFHPQIFSPHLTYFQNYVKSPYRHSSEEKPFCLRMSSAKLWLKYGQLMYGRMCTSIWHCSCLFHYTKCSEECVWTSFTCAESRRSAPDVTLCYFAFVTNGKESEDIRFPNKLFSQAWNCVCVMSSIVASGLN